MINSRDLKELHPTLRRGAEELIARCNAAGLNICITQTYRDSEYQDSLYAQGRTKPGQIVTKAKGGQSMHNYKLAFDFCKNVKGHEYDDNTFFENVGRIWSKMGGTWGGDWKDFIDLPHCEFTGGLTLKQLQTGEMPANYVIMKWEVKEQPEPKSTVRFDLFGEKTLDISGFNIDGVIYAGARELLEAMGYLVVWNNEAKTVCARKKTMFPITNDEHIILEKIVEAEAGAEDDHGKLLVANVVLNRVKFAGFPNNIKDVVFQDAPSVQFTPTINEAYDKAVPSQATKKAVQQALCGVDYSQGACFFCNLASAANPKSYHELERTFLFQHGGHRFYK